MSTFHNPSEDRADALEAKNNHLREALEGILEYALDAKQNSVSGMEVVIDLAANALDVCPKCGGAWITHDADGGDCAAMDVTERVIALLKQDKYVAALREYQRATGADLEIAKSIVGQLAGQFMPSRKGKSNAS